MGIKIRHDPNAMAVALAGLIGGYGEHSRFASQLATQRRGQSLAAEGRDKDRESAERRQLDAIKAQEERQRVAERGARERAEDQRVFTAGRDERISELAKAKADEDMKRRIKEDKLQRRNGLNIYEEKQLVDYERAIAQINEGVASGDYTEAQGKRLLLEAKQRYSSVADLKGIKKMEPPLQEQIDQMRAVDDNGVYTRRDVSFRPHEKPGKEERAEPSSWRELAPDKRSDIFFKARDRAIKELTTTNAEGTTTLPSTEAVRERVNEMLRDMDQFDSSSSGYGPNDGGYTRMAAGEAAAKAKPKTGKDLDAAFDRLSPQLKEEAKALISELGTLKRLDDGSALKRRVQILKNLSALGLAG